MGATPQKKNTPARYRYLWWALVALALGAFLLVGYVLWSAYLQTWQEARATVSAQAGLIEARLDATLRRVDAGLADLAASLPADAFNTADPAQFELAVEARLARLNYAFPEVAGFRVIDGQGVIRYHTGGAGNVEVKDRDYFQGAQALKSDELYFSQVITSRLSGHPVVVAARSVRASDGRFLGVVTAAIEIDYFDHLFKDARLGEAGVLLIRRSDNHALVVRQPAVVGEVNRPLEAAHPLHERIRSGVSADLLEYRSPVDAIQRIYAYRVLAHYPFYVLAGVAEQDRLSAWWQRAYAIAGLGVALFLSLGLVLFWLFRAQARVLETAYALKRNQDQLREAQRVAHIGSWESDLSTNTQVWSDELYQIFEMDPSVDPGSYEAFLARVHPEDRQRVDLAYRSSLQQRTPYDVEHRFLMPDGRVKFLHTCGENFYDEAGQVLRSIGTVQDITGRRQMEARMHLLSSAFQYSGEAILISDHENRIVAINPSFTRLTGYTQEEALGRNPRFLSAGRTSAEEYLEMWGSIRDNGFWQGEIWDRRKDGGIYPKWMSISAIRDDGGELRYYVAHFTDVSAERAAEARLHHLAHHDALTGLLNRFSLRERLDQALSAARREGSRVALMFADLDRFKVINDTLGHHMGDELLIEVARRLTDSVRESDVVARLGGDEFVVMLTGIENANVVAKLGEKLVDAISDPYVIEGHDLYTSPSIGIAIFPTDGEDAETLMKNADAAMYHAKASGRHNFKFFDGRMNNAALERLSIEHALRQALARDEFCLHFQPIIEMSTGRVSGVEALVRWQHPEKGLLMPGKFIGIAEETGLIQPLGDWVFWAACRQLREFRTLGIENLQMGINISAIQMRTGNLPLLARGAIEALDLNPGSLVFEITESVAMEQPEETVRILNILHDMGVRLAVDDFGTGYSSLSHLRMFPIDHLKLDRSFVQEIGVSKDGSVICDATIGLAHNLGLKLVAEGVETEEQRVYLQARGCDLVQGYFYSKPLPVEQIVDFIRARNL